MASERQSRCCSARQERDPRADLEEEDEPAGAEGRRAADRASRARFAPRSSCISRFVVVQKLHKADRELGTYYRGNYM